jgi:predicted ATPase
MQTMRFAVEVLLDPEVSDDFGDVAEVRHSRLRYELALTLRSPSPGASSGNGHRERFFVDEESVRLIRKQGDGWVERYGRGPGVRGNLARYSSRSSDMLLETGENPDGRPAFVIHQDGRAGRTRHLPANEAVSTVLSTLTTANDYPMLYALKRELESWGLLHLDPGALRSVNSFDDDESLAANGANLANALHRITMLTATADRPLGVLSDIATNLSEIVPEVVDLEVEDDRARRQRHIIVRTRDDAPYSSSVASDGTLRALALLVALHDPERRGLICFEEPENGIYPQRLVDFVRHLRDLAYASVDRRAENARLPLLQLLLSSHSPVILRALPREDVSGGLRNGIAFFDTVALIEGDQRSRVSRARQVRAGEQTMLSAEEMGLAVTPAEIDSFEVWKILGET